MKIIISLLITMLTVACSPKDSEPNDSLGKGNQSAIFNPESLGEGVWLVGTEILVATYKTTVSENSEGCYWARLSDFDGNNFSIIDEQHLEPRWQGEIKVRETDIGVEFVGDCIWVIKR